jgi:ABC-type transport system involved in cytochrome bd biosynthesis fused ATPase/permease subunit
MLRDPLNVMPQAFMAYSDAKMSLGHITTFLNTEEKLPNNESPDHAPYEEQVKVGFELESSTFEWRSPEQARLFQLTIRRTLFPPGKLSIISGPSSSGKTSLLAALLGDMNGDQYGVLLPSRYLKSQQNRNLARDTNPSLLLHKVAYVAQQAWIEHGTIRENILFSETWDDTRYRTVLHQCDLLRDLSLFDNGDLTSTSDQGVSGSGNFCSYVEL